MSHGIIAKLDKVISTKGTEWHGLAEVFSAIGEAEIAQMLFPIAQGEILASEGIPFADKIANLRNLLGAGQVERALMVLDNFGIAPMEGRKALLADRRAMGGELTALHIPKNSYEVVTNAEIWEIVKKTAADTGAIVTSAGTLEGCKKFFVSLEFPDKSLLKANGDDFKAHLNFVTSHDGTIGVRAYDSMIRIVCMNTLRASLASQGKVGFTVYHSKSAGAKVAKLPELIAEVMTERAEFIRQMELLDEMKLTAAKARHIVGGWFATEQAMGKAIEPLATRSRDSVEQIIHLFAHGQGNEGASAYDLLNGFTEYFTHGEGCGKKATTAEKAYKANFGGAAARKDAFFESLLNPAEIELLTANGEKALRA